MRFNSEKSLVEHCKETTEDVDDSDSDSVDSLESKLSYGTDSDVEIVSAPFRGVRSSNNNTDTGNIFQDSEDDEDSDDDEEEDSDDDDGDDERISASSKSKSNIARQKEGIIEQGITKSSSTRTSSSYLTPTKTSAFSPLAGAGVVVQNPYKKQIAFSSFGGSADVNDVVCGGGNSVSDRGLVHKGKHPIVGPIAVQNVRRGHGEAVLPMVSTPNVAVGFSSEFGHGVQNVTNGGETSLAMETSTPNNADSPASSTSTINEMMAEAVRNMANERRTSGPGDKVMSPFKVTVTRGIRSKNRSETVYVIIFTAMRLIWFYKIIPMQDLCEIFAKVGLSGVSGAVSSVYTSIREVHLRKIQNGHNEVLRKKPTGVHAVGYPVYGMAFVLRISDGGFNLKLQLEKFESNFIKYIIGDGKLAAQLHVEYLKEKFNNLYNRFMHGDFRQNKSSVGNANPYNDDAELTTDMAKLFESTFKHGFIKNSKKDVHWDTLLVDHDMKSILMSLGYNSFDEMDSETISSLYKYGQHPQWNEIVAPDSIN